MYFTIHESGFWTFKRKSPSKICFIVRNSYIELCVTVSNILSTKQENGVESTVLFPIFGWRKYAWGEIANVRQRRRAKVKKNIKSYVRDTKSYVRDTKSYVRDTKSYVRLTKSYVQDTKSYVRDTKSYVRDTKSYVRLTKSYVRDTKSYVRDNNSYVRDTKSFYVAVLMKRARQNFSIL